MAVLMAQSGPGSDRVSARPTPVLLLEGGRTTVIPIATKNTPPGSNGKRELMVAVPRALRSRTGELILRILEKKIDKRVDHK